MKGRIPMKTKEMVAILREGDLFSADVADRLEELVLMNKTLEERLARARKEKQHITEQYADVMRAIRNLYNKYPDFL